MAKASYLIRRGGRYFLRVRVPDCLQRPLGLREIRRTTGTSELRRAKPMAAIMAGRVLAAFGDMLDLIDVDSLTVHEITAMTTEEVEALPSEDRIRLAERYARLVRELEDDVRTQLLKRDMLRRDLAEYREVFRQLQDEELRGARIRADMAALKMQTLAFDKAMAAPTAVASAPLSDEARKPWWEHIPTFFREKPQNEENRANYEREFERLAAVIGKDRPLGEIRRADLDAYHDHILAVAKPRKGNNVLSAKSQERCLSHIKSFFSWAYLKEWIERDPSARISPKGLRPAQIVAKPRRPFTPQELTLLFHAPLFTGCKGAHRIKEAGTYLHRGGKYWLPLLAIWTGGRLRELTDLKVSDLARWDELWYLNLAIIPDPAEGDEVPQDEAGEEEEARPMRRKGKSQKTPHAKRLAPLHPDLLALGFLEFVEGRKEAGGADALLFDEVGDYGPVFNRDEFDKDRVVKGILASVGVKYHDTSFHSFRHVFADALRDSGLDSRLQDRLMGHAPKGAAKHYGSPLTPGEAAQFAALRQCISLDHLLPANRDPTASKPARAKPAGKRCMGERKMRKVALVPGKLKG